MQWVFDVFLHCDPDGFCIKSALQLSAEYGSLEMIKFLVEKHDFDIFDKDSGSDNAFLISARKGKTDQMEYFVNKNPDILRSVCNENFNALHLSASYGTLQTTKFLVEEHDFDISDSSNKNKITALELAQRNRNTDQVEYLKSKKVKKSSYFFLKN